MVLDLMNRKIINKAGTGTYHCHQRMKCPTVYHLQHGKLRNESIQLEIRKTTLKLHSKNKVYVGKHRKKVERQQNFWAKLIPSINPQLQCY